MDWSSTIRPLVVESPTGPPERLTNGSDPECNFSEATPHTGGAPNPSLAIPYTAYDETISGNRPK